MGFSCPTYAHRVTPIEVYADVWCPFADVGLRCVAERRGRLGREDVRLHVRAWPLELVNGAPLDPTTTAHHIHDLKTQVAPDLFAGFDPEYFPSTTLPALAVVHAAYARSMEKGEAVSFALRDALFEEGLDISRPEVLTNISGRHNVDAINAVDEQSIFDDWHDGVNRGVRGSPHFFCGDLDAYCPSLVISKGGMGQLEVNANLDVLDSFLLACFEE